VADPASLVRLAFIDGVLVARARGGRGVYVHDARCLERAGLGGLARALRQQVGADDLARIVSSLSRPDDNHAGDGDRPDEFGPGQGREEAVETSPRTTSPKREDQRSEDARL
jgi:hypothetical protein